MKSADFGLTGQALGEIVRCIEKRDTVREALIFGSRAKGTFTPGSDVDIALRGPSVSHQDVLEIAYELNEEGYLPWRFDILDYNTIDNSCLREHIDRAGKIIFRNQQITAP